MVQETVRYFLSSVVLTTIVIADLLEGGRATNSYTDTTEESPTTSGQQSADAYSENSTWQNTDKGQGSGEKLSSYKYSSLEKKHTAESRIVSTQRRCH